MRVMLSGCSGGGKSTLLSELAERGRSVVADAALRVLPEEQRSEGRALPWVDAMAFGRRALAMSVVDHEGAHGLTFFDRGVVDAGVVITARGGSLPVEVAHYRYDQVFLAPPWPEIYEVNEDRRHRFGKAVRDYERIQSAYTNAGYEPIELPRDNVAARAELVLTRVTG
ncbi:AAA family ATPase [Porphyrobacter algicida]|uniref:AAA family ATPase n=2 Tax=Qipengyuania algicida TaxID=1836209 RepID=A0A845AM81_9SPHN|nr:AAA family ATPase [Qipengyuania algicida]